MAKRFYDQSQPMRALAQTAGGVGQVFSDYAQKQYRIQTAQEYNRARVSMLRETNNFLVNIEKDPDYRNYQVRFEEFERGAYDQINAGIHSTDAQRQFEADWHLQMENLPSDVQQLSLKRGRVVARGEMVLELEEILNMPPTGTLAATDPAYDEEGKLIDKRGAFVQMQKGRINDLLTAGVVGGYLAPEEHIAMLAQYIPAFEKTYAANEVLRQIRSGTDLQDVEHWIHEQTLVGLGVQDREQVIAAARNESVVYQRRLLDESAATRTQAQNKLLDVWSDPDEWRFLARDNFKEIRNAPITPSDKEHWIDKVTRRLNVDAEVVADGISAQEYQGIQQDYTAELQQLIAAGVVEDIEAFKVKATDDTDLKETDRRYYINQAESLVANIYAAEAREAQDEEKRLEAEEKQRQAERHLSHWKEARDHLERGTLTKEKIDSYDTFSSANLNTWYNALEQWQKRQEVEAERIDPYKTRPEVEQDIFSLFWNPAVSHADVEEAIKNAQGDGLSFNDAAAYLKDLTRRDALLRDPIVMEYEQALERFFASQYYSDMADAARADVAMEQAAALAAFRALNDDPETRGLPESARRAKYDALLIGIANRPTTRRLGNLFGKEIIPLYTPQRLREEWLENVSPQIIRQQVERIGQEMIAEYREQNLGPVAGMTVLDELLDGYIVFYHGASGTYFRRPGKTGLFAPDWEIGQMDRNKVDWKRWTRRRMEDFTSVD